MDKWNILLESKDDGLTVATVLEVPDLQTTDETKQGAIEKIRQLLKQRLAKAEIVQIETPIRSVSQKNNLMQFAGIFANDPDFQDIISQIQAEREDNI